MYSSTLESRTIEQQLTLTHCLERCPSFQYSTPNIFITSSPYIHHVPDSKVEILFSGQKREMGVVHACQPIVRWSPCRGRQSGARWGRPVHIAERSFELGT
jgi:hypothetical protein